ncbi:RWD-domain-containing protein [Aureobasidium sp. EXF-10727]|nr:RWD-domain-containing protein [Aureobasidium sp. EXF-10727]
MDIEDERHEELSTISAIYPELLVNPNDPFAASLHLPVNPSNPLALRFPSAPPPSPPDSENGHLKPSSLTHHLDEVHRLEHLPPLQLSLSLPEGYPAEKPPKIALSTTPQWLPDDKLKELESECEKLWEEYGRCQILFSYIDFLQQQAEQAFDLEATGLDLSPALKPALLDYNFDTKKAVFDTGTFDCGICLEPKKGSSCYRMRRCGHVFCQTCLQDFYNNCITEGDVGRVQCLDPTCGKDAPAAQQKRRKEKTLHPRELLDMGLEEPMVRRFVDMKRKKKQEADKTTVYCPRTWCQGPARSTKYPPLPQDLTSYPESSSEDEDDTVTETKGHSPSDRLAICSKCTFAFCKTCYAGWHGDFARCWPRNPSELSEEEKASYDYIRTHTSPCPTCSSPTQKTMGCNHMRCVQCATHFCYLCGAWLCPDNPYQHFNKPGTECYQKLWELEEGDEGQEAAFVGARRWEQEALAVAQAADREEAEALQRQEDEAAARELAEQLDAQDNAAAAVVQPAQDNNVRPVAEAPPQPARRGGGRRARGGRVAVLDGRRAGAAAQQQQVPPNQQQIDAAAAAAFRRFVELAVRDEEDGWDSDELEDDQDERWVIPVRQ